MIAPLYPDPDPRSTPPAAAGSRAALAIAAAALLATMALACKPSTTPAAMPAVTTPAATPAQPAAAPAEPTPIADQYRDVAGTILQAALADPKAYQQLAYLSDRIGHRLSGSKSLEQAIAWAVEVMKAEGQENVHTEEVMVPHWVRGAESAEILAPAAHQLHILGLGMTVGTAPEGVTGEVVVVDDFEQLKDPAMRARIKGRIVLFNKKMPAYHPEHGPGYSTVSPYRTAGPSKVSALGAIATLMRSVTANSLRSPHTGALRYAADAPKIPAAAVTTEDADLIARLIASGQTVRVRLTLGAKHLPDAASANVIGELRGSEKPDEVVLIGAHIDSWDVGQGSHDDGGGCVVMMRALGLLRALNLRPKRTIRVVLFTNEENGLRGALNYALTHKDEVEKHVVGIEADTGVFAPDGFRVLANEQAVAQMRDIVTLLAPIGATQATAGFSGADLLFLQKAGMPGMGLSMDLSRYFDYHHTHADTMDKIDPEDLAKNVAAMAVVAYVLADMPERFAGGHMQTPPKMPF